MKHAQKPVHLLSPIPSNRPLQSHCKTPRPSYRNGTPEVENLEVYCRLRPISKSRIPVNYNIVDSHHIKVIKKEVIPKISRTQIQIKYIFFFFYFSDGTHSNFQIYKSI